MEQAAPKRQRVKEAAPQEAQGTAEFEGEFTDVKNGSEMQDDAPAAVAAPPAAAPDIDKADANLQNFKEKLTSGKMIVRERTLTWKSPVSEAFNTSEKVASEVRKLERDMNAMEDHLRAEQEAEEKEAEEQQPEPAEDEPAAAALEEETKGAAADAELQQAVNVASEAAVLDGTQDPLASMMADDEFVPPTPVAKPAANRLKKAVPAPVQQDEEVDYETGPIE